MKRTIMNKKLLFLLLGIVLGTSGVVALAFDLNIIIGKPQDASIQTTKDMLLIDGLVEHPLNLSLEELATLPKQTVVAALYCVDSPASPVRDGDEWTGVRLALVLERAQVSPSAVKVVFRAADGYSTDLTVSTAEREDVILAYQQNGEPLPEKLRLVVPGKSGYKWISTPDHIELVDYDFKGSWESRGYSDEAEVKPGPSNALP
jgi:DMSO/TMAO reductase YedYZ molybdopterin-dependent catalytic subunit